ncbi:SdpI family protein [uncultured Sphingomonas sp.]|uniref:SdpI family protein n=1 Tax=uncultured Sphingomonas sp. TaxID=158754 RepID=UPI0035C9EB71
MTYRHMTWAAGAVCAGLALVALVALQRYPAGAQLPTHWNAAGEADGFADAATALFLPVLLTLGLSALFVALPRLEPLQERLERSRALLVTAWAGLLGMMAVTEAMIAGPAFGLRPPATLVLAAGGVLLIAIGNMLPKSRPGFFVGIRTPWAILDEDNWVATHRLGAWTFIAGGLLMVAAGVLPLAAPTRQALVIAAIVIAALPPMIYSFFHWRARR